MKAVSQTKVRWLYANFQSELVALAWVALIYIYFNVDRAVYILEAPWGSALLLFSVVVSMVIAMQSLKWAWRELTAQLKWWGRQLKHVQQTAVHSIEKMHSTNKPNRPLK